jgi:hypothetical protein
MACSIRFLISTSPRMTRAWLSATSRLSGGPMPLGPKARIAVLAHLRILHIIPAIKRCLSTVLGRLDRPDAGLRATSWLRRSPKFAKNVSKITHLRDPPSLDACYGGCVK